MAKICLKKQIEPTKLFQVNDSGNFKHYHLNLKVLYQLHNPGEVTTIK